MRKGFWSYVHEDDEAEGKRISRLAEDFVAQYEMLTGDTIELFLDKDGIGWGDEWRKKIDDHLESVEFFIPVMTPRYFKSSECRRELNQLLRSARKFKRLELLLPLHYVDVPQLNHDEPVENELLRSVRTFQWRDWRELRFNDVTSEAYRRGVAEMAEYLVKANKDLEEVKVNADGAAPERCGETGHDEDDTPGTIDRLAASEEAMDKFNDTLMAITSEIEIIGDVMSEATSDIQQVGSGRGEFARRVQVVRRLSTKLTGPTDTISTLTNQYESQLYDIDDGIRLMIELAPAEIEENPDAKKIFVSSSSQSELYQKQLTTDSAVSEG